MWMVCLITFQKLGCNYDVWKLHLHGKKSQYLEKKKKKILKILTKF